MNRLGQTEGKVHATKKGILLKEARSGAPEEVAVDLQHHVLVQASLGRVQLLPLLPAEVHGHMDAARAEGDFPLRLVVSPVVRLGTTAETRASQTPSPRPTFSRL
ncbi:hypothetical protein Cadr_000012115 [Camelus dromedarius]|uniref:Uncharacterized protein n=1 Tax=Camelus dromedarius TaxID=9838 RepID=A0A5N4DS10_CAMDR|nr:hypothetical protein Cadr_000012115 [Camelus dromedarius]